MKKQKKSGILALAAALVVTSLVDTGFGSPPHPLRSLLKRAETVLVVRMASHTETSAVFEIAQVLRGDATWRELSLGHTRTGSGLPKNTRGLLLFSQGDNYWGPPKSSFQVGQPIKGQASYRGWILMDGPPQSKEELKRLKQLVEQNPYKPDFHYTLSARILLPAEIKPSDGARPAKLELTNTGEDPVRVLTHCYPTASTFMGCFRVRLRPQSEQHAPSIKELAKSVVELSQGESTTLPFEFTDPGHRMPRVWASYQVSEELAEKLNVWFGLVGAELVVFIRTDSGVLRFVPPEQLPLCGSRLSIEEAVKREFAFVAACEALEDTQGEIGAIGKLNCTQEFKLLQPLAGDGPGVGKFRLHYTYVDHQDCRERAVRKGERVIWVVRKKPGDVPPWHCIKALPDTQKNRAAVRSLAPQTTERTSAAPSRNAEADILDYAAKHPRNVVVREPDGTSRRPKYGDFELKRAEEALKNFAKPWTVKKVLSWYTEAKDGKTKAHLLRVLAASRHPKAAVELGKALDDSVLDVRVAATYGLLDYFLPDTRLVDGGTESHMIAAAKWWQENRQRLLLAAATQPAAQRRFEDVFIFVNNYPSGVTNGATGTLSLQGWIECGHPGAVSKVTWQYVRTTGQGDVYLMTRTFPHNLTRDPPAKRQVTYAGVPLVVFTDKDQRIVLLPRRLKHVSRDGLNTDDALALLKENGGRELNFNMDLLATPAALPALAAIVREAEGSEHARMRAALVLGRIGSGEAREVLIAALQKTPKPDADKGRGNLWSWLVDAVARCIEREPEKELLDDLGHGQPKVRYLAAIQLGKRKSAAVPALIALLDDKHPDPRLGATWALGEIGDVRGDAALLAIVEGRRGGGSTVSAIEAMGKIGTDQALEAVKSIKPDHPAHWKARKVLEGWGSEFRKPASRDVPEGTQPPVAPATQPEVNWGQAVGGLRCRLTADKPEVPMGSKVDFILHLRFDPKTADPKVEVLDRTRPHVFDITLTFRDVNTGKTFQRPAFDIGMPRPQNRVPLNDKPLAPEQLEVYLLSDDGNQVPAGEYAVTATCDVDPDRVQVERSSKGVAWSGKIVSGPVPLTVTPAEPKTVEIQLPTALRFLSENGRLAWDFSEKDMAAVALRVRPGFNLVYRVNAHLFMDGDPLTPGDGQLREGGCESLMRADRGAWPASVKASNRMVVGGKLKVVADLEIIENSAPGRHGWSPVGPVIHKAHLEGIATKDTVAGLARQPEEIWGQPGNGLSTRLGVPRVFGEPMRLAETDLFLFVRNVSDKHVSLNGLGGFKDPWQFLCVGKDGKADLPVRRSSVPKVEDVLLGPGDLAEVSAVGLAEIADLQRGQYILQWSVPADKIPVGKSIPPPSNVLYLEIAPGKDGKLIVTELPVPVEASKGNDPPVRHSTRPAVRKEDRSSASQWGQPAGGLRCRAIPPEAPIPTGTHPRIAVQVECVADKPMIWRCISDPLAVRAPGLRPNGKYGTSIDDLGGRYVCPPAQVKTGSGARAATHREVELSHGIWIMEAPQPAEDDSANGFYRLTRGGRLTIDCTLPYKFDQPGSYEVDLMLRTFESHSGPPLNAGPDFKTEITCPPLVLQIAGAAEGPGSTPATRRPTGSGEVPPPPAEAPGTETPSQELNRLWVRLLDARWLASQDLASLGSDHPATKRHVAERDRLAAEVEKLARQLDPGRAEVELPASQPTGKAKLPGSRLRAGEAVAVGWFVRAVACKTIGDPSVLRGPGKLLEQGQDSPWWACQRFSVTDHLGGHWYASPNEPQSFTINYPYGCTAGSPERPIRKDEQVIWIIRGEHRGIGVKALPDTPGNRRLVKAATSDGAFEACQAFLEGIAGGNGRLLDAIVDVPFVFDRSRFVTDRKELAARLDAVVKKQAGKPFEIRSLASSWPASGLNFQDPSVTKLARELQEERPLLLYKIIIIKTDWGVFEAILRRTGNDPRIQTPLRVVAWGPGVEDHGDKWADWLKQTRDLLADLERRRKAMAETVGSTTRPGSLPDAPPLTQLAMMSGGSPANSPDGLEKALKLTAASPPDTRPADGTTQPVGDAGATRASVATLVTEAVAVRKESAGQWAQWDKAVAHVLAKHAAMVKDWGGHARPPAPDVAPLKLPMAYLVWHWKDVSPDQRLPAAYELGEMYLRAIADSDDEKRIDILLQVLGGSEWGGKLLVKAMTAERVESSIRELLAGTPKLKRDALLHMLFREFAAGLSPDVRKVGYDWLRAAWPAGPSNGDGEEYWETLFRLDPDRARREVIPYYGQRYNRTDRYDLYVLLALLAHGGPSEEVAKAVRRWRKTPDELLDFYRRRVLVCADPEGELESYVADIEAQFKSGQRPDELPYLVRTLVEHIPRQSVKYLRQFANDRRLTGLMGEGTRKQIVWWLVEQQDEQAEKIVARWLAEEDQYAQRHLIHILARQGEFARGLLKKARPGIDLPPLPLEKAPAPATQPGVAGTLSARIILPAEVTPANGRFPAKLDLTNNGKEPIRLVTLCQAWRSSSKGGFHVSFTPGQWKSDRPPVEQIAKSVVELSPGESTSLPFEVADGGGETLQVMASYVVDEWFAKKLNVWSGSFAYEPARVILERVEEGELRIVREEPGDLPPFPRKKAIVREKMFQLIEKLESPDPQSRREAIRGLESLGSDAKEAVPALVRRLKDEDAEVRSAAASSLSRILPPRIEILDVFPEWRRVAKYPPTREHMSPEDRARFDKATAIANEESAKAAKVAVPALIEALTDESVSVREYAASSLAACGPHARDAVRPLIDSLEDESEAVRKRAAIALWAVGPDAREAVPKLIAYIKKYQRYDILTTAMRPFGSRTIRPIRSGAKEAVPFLIELLQGPRKQRCPAAIALGHIGPEAKAAIPALIAALEDPDSSVRAHAAEALGEIGTDTELIVPALMKAANAEKDEYSRVRTYAERALRKLRADTKEPLNELPDEERTSQ